MRDEKRAFLAIYAVIIGATLATGTFELLLVYWIVPRLTGEPFLRLIRMAELPGPRKVPTE